MSGSLVDHGGNSATTHKVIVSFKRPADRGLISGLQPRSMGQGAWGDARLASAELVMKILH